jgi:hypothetical protein
LKDTHLKAHKLNGFGRSCMKISLMNKERSFWLSQLEVTELLLMVWELLNCMLADTGKTVKCYPALTHASTTCLYLNTAAKRKWGRSSFWQSVMLKALDWCDHIIFFINC